ncbi:hypothetical protein [Actibacterium sp. XHP0104]|uniref:hypothetical protein n=1 Tax=Actibacterium sp. XHP0104 TaxID=2984335 RepID=UPI0021E8C7B8|nr:hypothetical protein [Actibacterium sp. XHP0104]MCV2880661.1 hypothetical protein [Actibacterium sp. XHP0104]
MKPPGRPLFLARRNYSARRATDAARLLPLVGLFLFLMPLLWQADGGARSLTGQLIYIFGLWALLILGAFLLTKRLSRAADGQDAAAGRPVSTGGSDDQL